jgi:poly(A) polymerase
VLRVLDHPRFRAAYDFLLLRAAAGEVAQELADWWTRIQSASAEERLKMVEQSEGSSPARPRRRRRRRRTSQP